MWPFRCQKIKHRRKRIESRIELIEYKATQIRNSYFSIEKLFGEANDMYLSIPYLFTLYKFRIPVSCFYMGQGFSYYTDEELIYNKVKELINEYKSYINQIRKLHGFLEIIE